MNKMIGFKAIAMLGPVTAWGVHIMIDPPSLLFGAAWLLSWVAFFLVVSGSYDNSEEWKSKENAAMYDARTSDNNLEMARIKNKQSKKKKKTVPVK